VFQIKLNQKTEGIADVIEWHPRRNRNLGQIFHTDGSQVILNYIEIVEVEKSRTESEAKKGKRIE